MTVFPQRSRQAPGSGHMIVCGDDALAERLAGELTSVYRERVTLVVPPAPGTGTVARARASALLGRVQSVIGRTDAGTDAPRVLEAPELDEDVLTEAGVGGAAALALVHEDDEANIRAALVARRLNPRLRLVIRLYNRKLGQHLEELLDQAAALAVPGLDPAALDTSTTVLSDADTAAPALAATPAHDDTGRPAGLVWEPHPGYVLRPQDRVVLATTRQGLAELLGRRPRLRTQSPGL